jgi:hypothetical protein
MSVSISGKSFSTLDPCCAGALAEIADVVYNPKEFPPSSAAERLPSEKETITV